MADFRPMLEGLSDEMFTVAIVIIIFLLSKGPPPQRMRGSVLGRRHVRDRGRTGFDALRNEQMNFRAYFELSYALWDEDPDEFRDSFDSLAAILTPYLPRPKRRSRKDSVTPRERLFLALLWLGNGGKFTIASSNSGRAATTFSISVDLVVDAVIRALADEVRLPTTEEIRISTDWFRDHTGMLGCMGGLDGKHFEIKCPVRHHLAGRSYMGFTSLNCLVYCDHNMIARWHSKVTWGSSSDGGLWNTSGLQRIESLPAQ